MSTRAEGKKIVIFTIPNILSFLRLLMIPVIIWAYVSRKDYVLSAIILALSALTDVVDGFIARKLNQVSELGKALDPVADKLTQVSMLFCLMTNHPNMLLPVILLIVKEVLDGILNLTIIRRKGRVYGAVWHGKVTTVLLYGMMLAHVIWPNIPAVISAILITASVLMMIVSQVLYTKKNIAIIRSDNKT